MATAAEMGLRPGDIAISLSARREDRRGDVSGINLDYPGAQIFCDVFKVREARTPYPVPYGVEFITKGTLLQTNDPGHGDLVGKEIAIHDGFVNYYTPTDKRLQGELDRSGWYIDEQISPEGQKNISLKRRESVSTME